MNHRETDFPGNTMQRIMKNPIIQLIVFTLVLILSVAVTSCDVNSSMDTGSIELSMTDAPADYDAVFIDVQSVIIHKSEDAGAPEDSTDSENGGWITIMDEPMRINLLELRNGNRITLGETELEEGTYSQLRLILGSDNEVVAAGESHSLVTPSAQQSGLKVNIDAEIEEDETYSLLLDFDASRSIVVTGNGMYLLKPVLRAADLDDSGSLTGEITPPDVQTRVLAVMEEDTLSTLSEENGEFSIIGMDEGLYEVTFQPEGDVYEDSTMTDVEIESGEETDLGTIELRQN